MVVSLPCYINLLYYRYYTILSICILVKHVISVWVPQLCVGVNLIYPLPLNSAMGDIKMWRDPWNNPALRRGEVTRGVSVIPHAAGAYLSTPVIVKKERSHVMAGGGWTQILTPTTPIVGIFYSKSLLSSLALDFAKYCHALIGRLEPDNASFISKLWYRIMDCPVKSNARLDEWFLSKDLCPTHLDILLFTACKCTRWWIFHINFILHDLYIGCFILHVYTRNCFLRLIQNSCFCMCM